MAKPGLKRDSDKAVTGRVSSHNGDWTVVLGIDKGKRLERAMYK